MKRYFVLFLVLVLLMCSLCACGSKEQEEVLPEETATPAPTATIEATPMPVTYNSVPLDDVTLDDVLSDINSEEQEVASDEPIADESSAEGDSSANTQSFVAEDQGAETEEDSSYNGIMPFASPTPQPNASISRFAELSGTGLGFKFNYPADWSNIPGRSSVCFIQPIEEGTVYPARVSMTLKVLSHKCGPQTEQEELVSFLKLLRTQYDSKTFSVDANLDTTVKFMGNKAISTTYLAYDGSTEIKGYIVMTYFERYLYCFHFLCAYDDYPALENAMYYMKDSVVVSQEELKS